MIEDIMKIVSVAYYRYKFQSFVDLFGGSGKVLLNLPDDWNVLRIYNDIDERWYVFFKVLQNNEKRKKLVEMMKIVPQSRQLFEMSLDAVDKVNDDVIKAFSLAYILVNSRHAGGKDFIAKRINRKGTIQKKASLFDEFSNIIGKWQIERMDAIRLLKNLANKPYVFVYLDPPYIEGGKEYKENEWNVNHLKKMKEILDNGKCLWLLNEKPIPEVVEIFGEPNFTKQYINHSSDTKSTRTEGFWFNFKIEKDDSILKYIKNEEENN